MGGNFKFQVQDSFLGIFFFEIWRSKNQIALSEKKQPLVVSRIIIGIYDILVMGRKQNAKLWFLDLFTFTHRVV